MEDFTNMTQKEFKKILNECKYHDDAKIVKAYAKVVAQTGNPYFICDFAEFVRLSDHKDIMPILEEGMLRTGDIVHCYEFAFCMADHDKAFNLKSFEDLVIDNKRYKLMFYFLECVKGANIQRLTKAFLNCTNSKWLKAYMENEDIEKFNTNEELEQLYNALVENEKYQKEPSEEEIDNAIKSKNPEQMNSVMERLSSIPSKLFNAIMQTDDLLHIYEVYCSVPSLTDKQKEKILRYIEKNDHLNSPKYMYYVSAYTDLDFDKTKVMADAASKIRDTEYDSKIVHVMIDKLKDNDDLEFDDEDQDSNNNYLFDDDDAMLID